MSHSVIRQLYQKLEFAESKTHSSRLDCFDGSPVLIYGAGNVGKDVFRLLTHHGISVRGFLDHQAKSGSNWQGVPIWQPDDPCLRTSERQHIQIVMGIFNAYNEMPPITQMLDGLGYQRVISFLELHDRLAAELGDRFWLTSRRYYLGLEPEIAAAFELWSDETSRDLYTAILRFCFTGDYSSLPARDVGPQYFPMDIPPWPEPLRFVDCGAYDGDTIDQLMSTGRSVDAIVAFEPDPTNFARLVQYVHATRSLLPETVCLFPCGVEGGTEQLRFSSDQGSGGHISTSGATLIQCVSLDEALPRFRPNLIKMDIEGSEYRALWGARQAISELRPGLAICLYHRPEHLWSIPLLVRQLTGGGGQYFLRAHSFNGFELVFYWIPD